MERNAPYSKKPQNMIYSKSIKIITHLVEAKTPPFEVVFFHLIPIVRWKSPILPFNGKVIRGRARLFIHIKQRRICPRIATVTVNSNWDISLQNNFVPVSIVNGGLQLKMKMILNEIEKSDLLIMRPGRRHQFLDFRFIVDFMIFPLVKVRGIVF